MTFSYVTSPMTDRDYIRFLLGDVDSTAALFSDEEIDGILLRFVDVFEAAAELADTIASQYARLGSVTIGGFSVSGGDKASAFSALALSLRARSGSASGGLGLPIGTGMSISEMDAIGAESDRNPSRVGIGMHDAPGGLAYGSVVYQP